MRRILYFALILITLVACSDKDVHKEEVAAQVAKAYYDLLLQQKYSDFVSGMADADSLPADYRVQLEDNARMFVGVQQKEHEGIDSFTVSRATIGEGGVNATAYLLVWYKDKTSEEICVAMQEKDGVWYMR